MQGSSLLMMVHELIDPATVYRDETLIRDNFWGVDADRILQIPLQEERWKISLLGSIPSHIILLYAQSTTLSGTVGMAASLKKVTYKVVWPLTQFGEYCGN